MQAPSVPHLNSPAPHSTSQSASSAASVSQSTRPLQRRLKGTHVTPSPHLNTTTSVKYLSGLTKIYYPDLNSRAEHCAAQLASSELSAQSGVPSHTER